MSKDLIDRLRQSAMVTKRIEDEAADRIESLRQQLAAALAACKLKDVTLEAAHNGLRWWMDAFPLHVTEADNEEMLKLVKALTIQPDDAALKAWLGEPVAYADPLDIAKDGNWDTFIVKHASECNDTLRFKAPLYSPKGLK